MPWACSYFSSSMLLCVHLGESKLHFGKINSTDPREVEILLMCCWELIILEWGVIAELKRRRLFGCYIVSFFFLVATLFELAFAIFACIFSLNISLFGASAFIWGLGLFVVVFCQQCWHLILVCKRKTWILPVYRFSATQWWCNHTVPPTPGPMKNFASQFSPVS